MSLEINFSETEVSNENIDVDVANASNTDVLKCFVCDAKADEKHYALASCRTQTTRTRVIEKLGELVGERHMVVISEKDVICRSCANLINTLDRLESEIKGVKGTVLQYLERKYGLEEGDLNESVKPPHVTQTSENGNKRKATKPLDESISQSKQRKSVSLQCDKCRYVTDSTTFMVHHIRQHINQRINCDRCGVQFLGSNQQNNSHSCEEKQRIDEITNENEVDIENSAAGIANPLMENGDLAEEAHAENIFIKGDMDQKLFNLSDLDADEMSTQYVVPELTAKFLMQEQNIDDDVKPDVLPEMDSNGVLQKKDISTKQILTITEDGSLEVREVENWPIKKAKEEF